MMPLSVVAALLGASCSAFAPKPLCGTPRRTAKRQSLQMNVITDRPARAALAAAYVGFAGAIATFPGEFNNPADIQLIQDALNDPTSMNPVFFFIFNSLGLIPAVNAAVLLPGAKDQRPLPAAPFVASSFFAGYGGVGPYMILREPRFGPIKRSELGFFPRVVTESKLFGAGLVAGAVGLYGGLLTQLSDGALSDYIDLAASSKLVSVSSVDFLILSLFAFEPIKEDMSRRGWWGCYGDNDVGRLAAFCFPVLGPAAYVLLRPALKD